MSAIRINGIRVGHQMRYLRQVSGGQGLCPDLFLALTRAKINLPCIGAEDSPLGKSIHCCLEGDLPPGTGLADPVPSGMISVYPHGSRTRTLGVLLELFAAASVPFFALVSSSAMISFMVPRNDRPRALSVLEHAFDLPPSHTPYSPGFQEETAAFVKKRYQETRAYFEEARIKTYGFDLKTRLVLSAMTCIPKDLITAGRSIASADTSFYFSAVLGHDDGWHVYCLADGALGGADPAPADLVTFHGPHFGDRFGIFNTAAVCLDRAGLRPILAGCTGASVGLVLKAGQGVPAVDALKQGFLPP